MTTATTTMLTDFILAARRGDLERVARMLDADPTLAEQREPAGERAIHAAWYFRQPSSPGASHSSQHRQ